MDFPKNHKVVNKVRFLVKKRKDNQGGYRGNKNVYYQVNLRIAIKAQKWLEYLFCK